MGHVARVSKTYRVTKRRCNFKKKMFCDNFLTYLFLVYVVCEWKGWYVSLYSVLVIEIIRIK